MGELGRTAAPPPAQDPHPDAAPQRERREPLQAQRRPPLRSRRAALRPLPRQRPAIFLRVFRPSGCHARRGAAGQETAHRGQADGRSGPAACSISAPAGAAWGFISAQVAGAGYVQWHHPVGGAAGGSRASAPRRPACRTGCSSNSRITATPRAPSTASSRSACSSMWARLLRRLFLRLPHASRG